MLILSHNVDQGGANVGPLLLEWIDREQPDLITLQELIRGSVDGWRTAFVQRRYHVVDTFASRHFKPTFCDYDPKFQLHKNAHAAVIARLQLDQALD